MYILHSTFAIFVKRTLGIPMSLFPAEPSWRFPVLFGALVADLVSLLSFVVFSVGVEGRTSGEFSFCLLAAGFLSPTPSSVKGGARPCFSGTHPLSWSASDRRFKSPQYPTVWSATSVPHLVAESLPLRIMSLHTFASQRRPPWGSPQPPVVVLLRWRDPHRLLFPAYTLHGRCFYFCICYNRTSFLEKLPPNAIWSGGNNAIWSGGKARKILCFHFFMQ